MVESHSGTPHDKEPKILRKSLLPASRGLVELAAGIKFKLFAKRGPNESVDLLEEVLGITFTHKDKPAKVALHDGRNKRIYRREQLGAEAPFIKNATYVAKYNTVFVKDEAKVEEVLTETMKAYILRKNPTLLASENVEHIREESFEPSINIEKQLIHQQFVEGFAQLMVYRTVIGKINNMKKRGEDWTSFISPSMLKALVMITDQQVKEDLLYNTPILNYDILRRHIANVAGSGESNLSGKEGASLSYHFGSFFALNALITLTHPELGFEENQVIDYLIDHPPATVDDLENPRTFILNTLRQDGVK